MAAATVWLKIACGGLLCIISRAYHLDHGEAPVGLSRGAFPWGFPVGLFGEAFLGAFHQDANQAEILPDADVEARLPVPVCFGENGTLVGRPLDVSLFQRE